MRMLVRPHKAALNHTEISFLSFILTCARYVQRFPSMKISNWVHSGHHLFVNCLMYCNNISCNSDISSDQASFTAEFVISVDACFWISPDWWCEDCVLTSEWGGGQGGMNYIKENKAAFAKWLASIIMKYQNIQLHNSVAFFFIIILKLIYLCFPYLLLYILFLILSYLISVAPPGVISPA